MSEPQTYIATRPACGHLVACAVDDPEHYGDTARNLASWSRSGFTITKVETESIRKGTAGTWCPPECPHRPHRRTRRTSR